jgi:hypothetical protein
MAKPINPRSPYIVLCRLWLLGSEKKDEEGERENEKEPIIILTVYDNRSFRMSTL